MPLRLERPFSDSGLVREGYALNLPVTVANGGSGERSLMSLDAENVVLEWVKPAEDGSGDVILRLYEAQRTATRTKLNLDLPVKMAWVTNMLEEKSKPRSPSKMVRSRSTCAPLRSVPCVWLSSNVTSSSADGRPPPAELGKGYHLGPLEVPHTMPHCPRSRRDSDGSRPADLYCAMRARRSIALCKACCACILTNPSPRF